MEEFLEPVRRVDALIVAVFQWVYNVLLDAFGMRVGTFIVASTVLVQVAVGLIAPSLGSGLRSGYFIELLFAAWVAAMPFYTLCPYTVVREINRLQSVRDYLPINKWAIREREHYAVLRVSVLGILCMVSLCLHWCLCLSFLVTQYGRCLMVRDAARALVPAIDAA